MAGAKRTAAYRGVLLAWCVLAASLGPRAGAAASSGAPRPPSPAAGAPHETDRLRSERAAASLGGRRRAQADATEPLVCAQFLERGEQAMLCGASTGREMCPSACGEARAPPPPPAASHGLSCEQLASRGMCSLTDVASVCPDSCEYGDAAALPGTSTRPDGAAVFQTSCLVFLELEGGCAHDLSRRDTALPPGTRVSDVCPGDCSGHGKCAPSAVDISFLGSTDDSSGFAATVDLHGGACVDGGGVTFDGDASWATITPGQDYGSSVEFSLAFWLLPAAEEVWEPHRDFKYARKLYDHPPRSASSVAGGITLSLSRTVWLGAWMMHVSIAGTRTYYAVDLLRDSLPKWTHFAIMVEPTQIQVFEDGKLIQDVSGEGIVHRKYAGTMDLASELYLGGSSTTYCHSSESCSFRGSIAMLQLYVAAASAQLDVQCVFDGGKELVQNKRMAQDAPSSCRGRVSTGCTNQNAYNYDSTLPASAVDDGSCQFAERVAVAGEHGLVHVTDDWQRVDLSGSYSNPIVLCGVVTRDSTTEAVVRVRSVTTDPRSGSWYFEIAAEQKSCHSSDPPPTSEHVDFIVVEASVSVEGWQAGLTRMHDADWHRVSLLQEMDSAAQLVLISQVQTYDNRTEFVSTRHYFPPDPEDGSNFVGVHLEVGWHDAREYCRTHYHDLASIHSAAENALVASVCAETHRTDASVDEDIACYIGYNDIAEEGRWQWTDASPNDFAHFDDPIGTILEGTGGPTQNFGLILPAGASVGEGVGDWADAAYTEGSQSMWENPTAFVCERHRPGRPAAQLNTTQEHHQRNLAFFLKLQGEGVWCQDGEFFAEYYDNLDLSGSPHATQCEIDVPNKKWHSASLGADQVPGVPPILVGTVRTLAPQLFSARWTARMVWSQSGAYVFSSNANQGSRIVVNGATILDSWEECCSTFFSEPLYLSAGAHRIVYEYRSGYTADYSPTDSYAELSWTVGGKTFGAVAGSNSTNLTTTAREISADVGWLACSAGQGTLHTRSFLSGLVVTGASLATAVHFGSAFSEAPRIFAAVVTDADLSTHLRLMASATEQASIATEYDTCEAVFDTAETTVAWIALSAMDGQSVHVVQRQTLPSDSAALLSIGDALQLPDYYRWRNGSDACVDRWSGIECRRDGSGAPRIVVLDIHNVDLTNQDIPWQFIGQLTALEEIALINLQVTGTIDGEHLCRLTSLQALILRQNQLRGTVPDCMAEMQLHTLWLDDNKLHGPLPQLSVLGQFLKGLPHLSLLRNRWAPLLATEKAALKEISEPLGVSTRPGGSDWNFAHSYEWERTSGAAEDRLQAAREVSYRQWSGGVPFNGFPVALDFLFPFSGQTTSETAVGRDGEFGSNYPDVQLSAVGGYISGSGDDVAWTASRPDDGSLVFSTKPAADECADSADTSCLHPCTPPVAFPGSSNSPPGILFDKDGFSDAMYGSRSLLIGASNTFFALVTPMGGAMFGDAALHAGLEEGDEIPNPYGAVMGLRPAASNGPFAWILGSPLVSNDWFPQGEFRVVVDQWAPSGYLGPRYQVDALQCIIWRTKPGHSSAGPVVEMAVITPDELSLAWTSTQYNDGLTRYAASSEVAGLDDIDLRNPAVDGEHVLAAGVPILGNWDSTVRSILGPGYDMQFRGRKFPLTPTASVLCALTREYFE